MGHRLLGTVQGISPWLTESRSRSALRPINGARRKRRKPPRPLRKSLKAVETAGGDLTARLRQVADAIEKDFSDASAVTRGNVGELADTIRRVADTSDEASKALKKSKKEVDEYGEAYRHASDQVQSFGDVSSNLAAVSGLARGLGLGPVADIGFIVSDVADATEGFGRLGPAARDAGKKAQEAAYLVTGFDVSIGAMAAGIGVAAIAVAAIAALVSVWAGEQQKLTENTRRWVEQIKATNELLAQGATGRDVAGERAQAQQVADAADLTLAEIEDRFRARLTEISGGTFVGVNPHICP